MNNEYYQTIFKRKSFHLFRNVGDEKITAEELSGIEKAFASFERLYPDIRTAIRIVPSAQVSVKRDSEYCILIYSEKKPNYLMNAGYIGEQLDLYLVKNNIGSLWYGIGRPDEAVYDGLSYVIMFAVHKVSDESLYRKDMFKAKRKALSDIWSGDTLGIADIVRFTPSACNSQPWTVKNDGGSLTVTRYRKQSRIGLMSPRMAFYFNRIDIGIFLCILEICMAEKNTTAERELYTDETDREYSPVAKYVLNGTVPVKENNPEKWYYEAVFLNNDEIRDIFRQMRETPPFGRETKKYHVTTKFMPEKTHEEWYGESVTVHITSYKVQEISADDGKMTANEGLKAEMTSGNVKLQEYIDSLNKNFHINGSYRDSAKYTEKVDFSDGRQLDITVTGTFGCGHSDGTVNLGQQE